MTPILLRNLHSPSDILMLTAAIRDLHRAYPHRFSTGIETACPEFWENNPYISRITPEHPGVRLLDCRGPSVKGSHASHSHDLTRYISFLNEELHLDTELTELKADLHISRNEKTTTSMVERLTKESTPYWILSAGGSFDDTITWWDSPRYQQVVDHFRGKILFAQIGKRGDYHPPLKGTMDFRGATDLRQLIQLIYHAQGVLCADMLLTHLAAATETPPSAPESRACVVIAGGRRSLHRGAYPTHQYIHTTGMLRCCASSGCSKARTFPMGDGSEFDAAKDVCNDVVMHKKHRRFRLGDDWAGRRASPVEDARYLPHCMDLIPAEEVIRRIETYFASGSLSYLKRIPKFACSPAIFGSYAKSATPCAVKTSETPPGETPRTAEISRASVSRECVASYQARLRHCVDKDSPYPQSRFRGRGIVICGGGDRYFPSAWVTINALRNFGCRLPIELWHLGAAEMTARMKEIVMARGVTCIDALKLKEQHPVRKLGGWQMKPYAIMHSAFQEVLFLDADNLPVRDPEFLFETPEYRKHGAIFWPDIWRLEFHRLVWSLCEIDYRDEREFESGQMVIDKSRCWKALEVAMHLNEYSDFYYRHFLGDKETFHLAWMKLGQSHAMPLKDAELRHNMLFQYDFKGNLLFQHRNGDKWRLSPRNARIPGFLLEDECFSYLDSLAALLGHAEVPAR